VTSCGGGALAPHGDPVAILWRRAVIIFALRNAAARDSGWGEGKWQLSSGGGVGAVWDPRGTTIYYRSVRGLLFAVDVKSSSTDVVLGTPREVKLPSSVIRRLGFDVSADGSRMLVVQEASSATQRQPSLAVVQNWFEEFRGQK
jgi:hypothetical protein